jgi:hypothetical protein
MILAALSGVLHCLLSVFLSLFCTMAGFVMLTVAVKFGGVVMLLGCHLVAIGRTRMCVGHHRSRI